MEEKAKPPFLLPDVQIISIPTPPTVAGPVHPQPKPVNETAEAHAARLQQIRHTLAGFSGTEEYHKLGHFPNVVATDGVAYLCNACNCYWLFDVIASWQLKESVRREPFQVWQLTVNADGSAKVTAKHDEPGRLLAEQEIPYADFPLPEGIKLWVECTATEIHPQLFVVLLPGEH